jgi:hypothetical protein
VRAGKLDPVLLGVAPAAKVQADDQLQRDQGRHFDQQALDRRLDQGLGVGLGGQAGP